MFLYITYARTCHISIINLNNLQTTNERVPPCGRCEIEEEKNIGRNLIKSAGTANRITFAKHIEKYKTENTHFARNVTNWQESVNEFSFLCTSEGNIVRELQHQSRMNVIKHISKQMRCLIYLFHSGNKANFTTFG